MAYDVLAARAERVAQRSTEPFTFTLEGRDWQLVAPDDAPADWLAWSAADYARRFGELVVPQADDSGDAIRFPIRSLTVGDMNALVAAWLGATPGE